MSEDLLFALADKAVVNATKDERWLDPHKKLQHLVEQHEHKGWKKMNAQTQEDKVLNHLRKAGSITVREAMQEYSIQSLTKRISNLRKMGYHIVSNRKRHPVTKQEYVRYTLEA